MGGPSFTLQHSKSKEIAAEAVFMPLSDVCILWSHWPSTQVHPKGRHEAGPKLMTEGGSLEAQSALRKDILKPCKPALRSDFQRTCLLGLLPRAVGGDPRDRSSLGFNSIWFALC